MIIVDLEMTCCDDDSFPKSEMEPIQIGAVCVDDTFSVVSMFMSFVKPVRVGNVTPFCLELTGIKKRSLEYALNWYATWRQFRCWCGDDRRMLSWGRGDLNWAKKECHRSGSGCLLQFTQWADLHRIAGCGQARYLRRHGMLWHGRRHDGLNDAMTYAKILKHANPKKIDWRVI